ncbi:MAG: sodium:proton antiporter [Phycisphaerae bacterium]
MVPAHRADERPVAQELSPSETHEAPSFRLELILPMNSPMNTIRFTASGALCLLVISVLAGPVPAWGQDVPATRPAPAEEVAAEHPDPEHPADGHDAQTGGHAVHAAPSLVAALPFAAILLAIAFLPLIHKTEHWWHHNRNKLIVAAVLALITVSYYFMRGTGVAHGEHVTAPGVETVQTVLKHALLDEYIPFIVLLFCLYTVCGGIQLRGDVQATPAVNTAFLGIGAAIASFVGTTGASMLLIRPLLQTNREREHVKHTVIFFIFLVSNIGGCLLPIGDPPLFLGYLKGVPFLWTFRLVIEWAVMTGVLLLVYYLWDKRMHKKEPPLDRMLDETLIEPLRIRGTLNFVWLLGVVLAVAMIVPGKPFPGTSWQVPDYFFREAVMLGFVAVAWFTTSPIIRQQNQFDFFAITEVAVLFVGIFITMQAPIEILHIEGPKLGLEKPWQFFWATGALSSFLDNAPTYVVFFTTANSMTTAPGPGIIQLTDGNFISEALLVAISLGAVFMGANTYIGNGPNFMVKSIAEQAGVKMPSFFGYMIYSVGILIPLFILVTLVFLL